MLIEESGERYPFRLRPDEIDGVEKRRLYRILADQAETGRFADLADRYRYEMTNISLPQETARQVTGLRVAKIMECVQLFLRGGTNAIYQHWHEQGQGEWSLQPSEDAPRSVTLFSTFYPDLAKPVLAQTYHQLGLTDQRTQAVPEVFYGHDTTYEDRTYKLETQYFGFEEEQISYPETGNVLHMLSISPPT